MRSIGGRASRTPLPVAGAPDSLMARMVREFDWASTPLGPADTWPPELKTVVLQVLDSGFPGAVVWGPEFTTIYNDAFRPILGDKPEALGRSFADIWAEAWDEIGPIARRAYAGEATYIENFPLVIDRSGHSEQAYFTFSYSPLRLADGSVAGLLDTVVETTATVKARTDLDLVNNELGHRLKNTLSLVQAMAAQTLRDVTEQEAVQALSDRIVALGQAHDILVRQNWTGSSLCDVVKGTLKPLDGLRQIEIGGPDLEISSRATMALCLMLHELATNAAKYGALSTPDGRIDLTWQAGEERFYLEWQEKNGPPVAEPLRKGFGSRLIDRGLGSGGVKRMFEPSGLRVLLEVPMEDLRTL